MDYMNFDSSYYQDNQFVEVMSLMPTGDEAHHVNNWIAENDLSSMING